MMGVISPVRDGKNTPAGEEEDRGMEQMGNKESEPKEDGGTAVLWRRTIEGQRRIFGDSRRWKNRGGRRHRGSSRLRREKTRRGWPRSGKNVASSGTEVSTGNVEEG
ncbi:hypothetical protein NDU88_001015 [Pleurodeles waltl]|uniref:Uncharacterized protein n=1 Tax=Pleurodeles waltl TaxID=8319 RepID=A0AAV7SBC1_PLEWA|nr:hypothetical protein NDU88_001015 [Pleurodeles waltl]